MDVKIHIPDSTYDWPMKHADKLYFLFDSDQNNFYTDTPDAFTPPLPSGGFPGGSKIGPYSPRKRKIDVKFYQDNDAGKPMHTIHIGD
jgi:hypothetical protein